MFPLFVLLLLLLLLFTYICIMCVSSILFSSLLWTWIEWWQWREEEMMRIIKVKIWIYIKKNLSSPEQPVTTTLNVILYESNNQPIKPIYLTVFVSDYRLIAAIIIIIIIIIIYVLYSVHNFWSNIWMM